MVRTFTRQPRQAEAAAEQQGVRLRHARSLVRNPPRGASAAQQEAASTVLLAALDEPALTAEERVALVRAVLDLGYPWALHLRPEDIAEARSPLRTRQGALAGVVALLVALATFTAAPPPRELQPRLELEAPATEPPDLAPRPRFTVQFAEAAVVSGAAPRLKRHLPRLVSKSQLAHLVSLGDWEGVINLANQCRSADPLRLDCLAEEAAAHLRLAQRALHWEQPPRERELASLKRLEHERSARALYRRYLSIAPSTDVLAPKLVRRLREGGDWVEWNPEAADRELAAILEEPWLQHGCVERYLATADAFEERALRTHDEDDRAQVDELRLVATEASTCQGSLLLCPCAPGVERHF